MSMSPPPPLLALMNRACCYSTAEWGAPPYFVVYYQVQSTVSSGAIPVVAAVAVVGCKILYSRKVLTMRGCGHTGTKIFLLSWASRTCASAAIDFHACLFGFMPKMIFSHLYLHVRWPRVASTNPTKASSDMQGACGRLSRSRRQPGLESW